MSELEFKKLAKEIAGKERNSSKLALCISIFSSVEKINVKIINIINFLNIKNGALPPYYELRVK